METVFSCDIRWHLPVSYLKVFFLAVTVQNGPTDERGFSVHAHHIPVLFQIFCAMKTHAWPQLRTFSRLEKIPKKAPALTRINTSIQKKYPKPEYSATSEHPRFTRNDLYTHSPFLLGLVFRWRGQIGSAKWIFFWVYCCPPPPF